MVSFDNVTKRYGEVPILSSVTFTIEPSEFVFLTGKSGSGKTTVMRLLTHQVPFEEGEIRVEDMNLKKLSKKDVQRLRRMIGVIYQDYKLLTERNVAENIALGLEIMGKPKSEIDMRVRELLELIQLPDKAKLFPSQISGGEAQRVCIARALAIAPKMLFADEPTGNLDDPTAFSIVKLLAKINELGTTVVMATHNMSLVERMNKRVIDLSEGKITDRPKKVVHQHKKESAK
ncbi:MAG TPA: cell division ATP-binding protein FtsE [Patescibacteria group bacterium]|nr:cell division ATP-binding protein FtsE [Patescibacteria group bacterium]